VADFDVKIDVREIEPIDRPGVIYSAFDGLKPGERMEIINDHDPHHLHQKLTIDRDGQFDWRYLVEGPVEWRIMITKLL
jgi:uncharacterized protein (DUF2249 family)